MPLSQQVQVILMTSCMLLLQLIPVLKYRSTYRDQNCHFRIWNIQLNCQNPVESGDFN